MTRKPSYLSFNYSAPSQAAASAESPDYPNHLSDVPRPLPRRIERVLMSIASLIDG
jgi:hypothetical protein